MDYEGHIANWQEGERLANAIGNSRFLMMRSHGTMNWGETIGQGFILAGLLTCACEKQIMALADQSELYRPSTDVIERTPEQARSVTAADGRFGLQNWNAALRRVKRLAPDFND